MKRKLLFIASLLLVSLGVNAQIVWVSQATNFADVSSGVRYASPVDSNIVWICSYDGSGGGANRQDYSRTVNGGTTWVAGNVPCPTSYDWSMIHGVSADTAFAMFFNGVAGSGGGMWRTVNGGTSWSQVGVGSIFTSLSAFPNIVYFWNNMEGLVMGDPIGGEYEIHRTMDGGDTWTRVDTANIPNPLTSAEYGIVGHFDVQGDNIWFDTNNGRVYRSHDRGQTWQVSSTGLTVPANGAIDIAFYSPSSGIARLYSTGGTNTVRTTSDSGATWTPLTYTGNMFGADLKYVPGTASRLFSTGAATGFIGSSYSDDGGATWTTIEQSAQRSALAVVDTMHIWAGGFTASPTSGGIFKLAYIQPVGCSDPSISPGTTTATNTELCEADSTIITSTGVYAPTVGDFAGVSWILSSADITGSADPLNEPSLVATYTFQYPAPATAGVLFINDGSLIGGVAPYGTYYWTPVVFGNATGASPQFLGDLQLDPLCTYVGTSVMVNVYDPNDPACLGTGISELINSNYSVNVSQSSGDLLNVILKSEKAGAAVLEIYDITGRQVYASTKQMVGKGINNLQMAPAIPAGTYIVKADVNGAVAVTKFVKQ